MSVRYPALLVGMQVPTAMYRDIQQPQNNVQHALYGGNAKTLIH